MKLIDIADPILTFGTIGCFVSIIAFGVSSKHEYKYRNLGWCLALFIAYLALGGVFGDGGPISSVVHQLLPVPLGFILLYVSHKLVKSKLVLNFYFITALVVLMFLVNIQYSYEGVHLIGRWIE